MTNLINNLDTISPKKIEIDNFVILTYLILHLKQNQENNFDSELTKGFRIGILFQFLLLQAKI